MGIVSLNGNSYVCGPIELTYTQRQAPAYRTTAEQRRESDPSIGHFLHRSFPLGIGWARIKREIGRGVGGLLDSTCWTALGPVTLGKLQEVQSHAANADHWKKAVNFKSDLWGMFEEDVSLGQAPGLVARKFGATSDDWTGGGTINPNPASDVNVRGFDMVVHKNALFVAANDPTAAGSEVVYACRTSTDGITWTDAALTGFPDSTTTNRYLTTTVTRRNNFDDDMAKLLSFGNVLLYALYLHPSSTDGNGTIAVYSSTDSGANWVLDVTIPSGDGPKAFVDWVTIGGVRSPVLVTAEGVWSIDYTNNTFALIYALDGDSTTGRWAVVHSDGKLYIGLSTGEIARLNIGEADNLEVAILRPGGDGLVTARQGRVNYMLTVGKYLLVAYGGHAASRNASIFLLDTQVEYYDPETGEMFVPWHHVHQDATANLDIVALAYSTEDDGTARLHFAVEGAAASVNSHIEEPFVNPKQSTTVKYQATSILRLPDDDLGDPQTTDTITQAFVDADDLSATNADEYIALRYGLNGASDTTTTLGDFLSGTLSQSFGSAAGVAARRIGVNLLLDRGATNTNTPKLQEFEMRSHHVLLGRRRWSMRVDIAKTAEGDTKPDGVADQHINETIIANLHTIVTSTTLVLFQDNETVAAVRVRVPPDAPPIFTLEVVGATAQTRGWRSGFVDLTLEEAI